MLGMSIMRRSILHSSRVSISNNFTSTSSKDIDITVFGATGFTGNLIAEYLTANEHHPNLQIALAGRNMEKLTYLKSKILTEHGKWYGADPILVATQTEDVNSLDELVSRSKVVLNCSGPYMRVGAPIVAACARLGVDYVDITGETPFARRVIDNHAAEAEKTGSFIVNMCGFDSLPSDLGTMRTVNRIKHELGEETRKVSCFVTMRGGLSGGTMESFMDMERDPEIFAQMKNPFILGGSSSNDIRDEDKDICDATPLNKVKIYSSSSLNNESNDISAWTGPFMMAEINTRVVRRSNELFTQHGNGYGKNFGYSERFLVNNELVAQKLAHPIPPIEKREEMRLQGRLPKPGEGPSKEERSKSSFHFYFIGESSSGKIVITTCSGGDPGYGETSKMVSEAALTLLINRNEMNASKLGYKGGVFTPSFTFGDVLVQRISDVGIKFTNEETPQNVYSYLNSQVVR